ncbi:MAG: hypothetical protein CEN87_486 [Parcubacteria group bacterium Licking1014_1]|nr:MAG: hypothetical protein CEN87_486 [Parcubacteria group bacterium Licking1014_1]
MTGIDFSQLSKKRPEKKLLKYIKRNQGRGSSGRITVRHKGGGVKKLYRIIEFGQKRTDAPAKVVSLEYDPNRTAFIALIEYLSAGSSTEAHSKSSGQVKERQYIIAPQGLKIGVEIIFSEKAPLSPGNRMKLKNMPVGTAVYNVELEPGKGGKIVRGAGTAAQILAQEGGQVNLKMPSNEIRRFSGECFASVGIVSNPENRFYTIGKAGRQRLKGIRPSVRGSAMNPVDHPHGGGEGRQPIGLKYPKTPWGKHALGVKTRKRKKWSNKLIMQRRKK